MSPPQAKTFVNGVIKVLNQAIRMILHTIILKDLPKDKKGGGVESIPEGEVYFGSRGRGGADLSQHDGEPSVGLFRGGLRYLRQNWSWLQSVAELCLPAQQETLPGHGGQHPLLRGGAGQDDDQRQILLPPPKDLR